MKLKVTGKRLVTLSFVTLSLGSLVYLSLATLNYLRFFPAFDSLQSRVTRVSFQQDRVSNQSRVVAHIVVENPSDYSGFRVAAFTLRMYFVRPSLSPGASSNETLFATDNILRTVYSGLPLQPRSEMDYDMPVPLGAQEASQLWSFLNNPPGQVTTRVKLNVEINTFLDPVTGHMEIDAYPEVPLSRS